MNNETVTPNICPVCGKKHDVTNDLVGNAKPKPGDITICIRCGFPFIFTDTMQLRLPDEWEIKVIYSEPMRVRLMIELQGKHFAKLSRMN